MANTSSTETQYHFIDLETDATDQATMKVYIHARVANFRSQQSLSAVATLHPAGDAVIVRVNGKKIGTLPSDCQPRALEFGCLFQWQLKSGPFKPVVLVRVAA